jgi:hypothetical protein
VQKKNPQKHSAKEFMQKEKTAFKKIQTSFEKKTTHFAHNKKNPQKHSAKRIYATKKKKSLKKKLRNKKIPQKHSAKEFMQKGICTTKKERTALKRKKTLLKKSNIV